MRFAFREELRVLLVHSFSYAQSPSPIHTISTCAIATHHVGGRECMSRSRMEEQHNPYGIVMSQQMSSWIIANQREGKCHKPVFVTLGHKKVWCYLTLIWGTRSDSLPYDCMDPLFKSSSNNIRRHSLPSIQRVSLNSLAGM